MSKILLVYFRDKQGAIQFPHRIEFINRRLAPDNINPVPPKILAKGNSRIAIFNPTDTLWVENGSVCMGVMLSTAENWWKTHEEAPEGSFAIFRIGQDVVEILTDAVASRTVWYVQTSDYFIASTSQRAIISFLGDNEFNQVAVSWMLSSGSLGPGNSWDKRISLLQADTKLEFIPSSWQLSFKRRKQDYSPARHPLDETQERLEHILADVFDGLQLDFSRWILPLSGGYDSRAILLYLSERNRAIRCVTWGDEGSLSDPENDAYIAQQLANHFNVEHFYCTTDITSDVELETLLNRYLVAGEGRIDHINAYLDGFRMWKMFFEAGVSGIIRGDEGFGHSDPTSSISRILYKDGLLRFSDFANLPEGLYLDFPLQTLPDYLHKGNQESIAAWRIRLYHEFRLPIILAALSDLKLSYLEVANPLLSRKIIAFVRQLPDELRKGKFLFKRIVQQKSPDIPFASRRAIPSSEKILATSHFQSLFVEELCSWETKSLFPEEMVRFIIDFLQTPKTSPNMLGKSWRRIYDRIALSNRTSQKFDMDLDKLALRIYLICKMKRILHEDTKLVRER